MLVDSWRGLGQGCWWKATEQVENIWEVGGDHTVHASILCAIQMTLARFFHSTRFFLGYDWTGLWHWKKKSTLNTSWITSIRRVTLLLRKDLELQRMKSFLSLFLNLSSTTLLRALTQAYSKKIKDRWGHILDNDKCLYDVKDIILKAIPDLLTKLVNKEVEANSVNPSRQLAAFTSRGGGRRFSGEFGRGATNQRSWTGRRGGKFCRLYQAAGCSQRVLTNHNWQDCAWWSRKDVGDLKVMILDMQVDPKEYPDSESGQDQEWLTDHTAHAHWCRHNLVVGWMVDGRILTLQRCMLHVHNGLCMICVANHGKPRRRVVSLGRKLQAIAIVKKRNTWGCPTRYLQILGVRCGISVFFGKQSSL